MFMNGSIQNYMKMNNILKLKGMINMERRKLIKQNKNMSEAKVKVEPFSWHDKMAQITIEDFDSIRDKIPYCECQSIGMALAK